MDKENEAQGKGIVVGVSLLQIRGADAVSDGRRWFDGHSSERDKSHKQARWKQGCRNCPMQQQQLKHTHKKGHLVNDTQDATSDLTGIQETKLFQFSDVVSQAEDCELICVGEEAERGAGG